MAGFDLKAMRAAIQQCDKNIQVFKAAIRKENETKSEYQRIVEMLEEKAANPPRVTIEVEPAE